MVYKVARRDSKLSKFVNNEVSSHPKPIPDTTVITISSSQSNICTPQRVTSQDIDELIQRYKMAFGSQAESLSNPADVLQDINLPQGQDFAGDSVQCMEHDSPPASYANAVSCQAVEEDFPGVLYSRLQELQRLCMVKPPHEGIFSFPSFRLIPHSDTNFSLMMNDWDSIDAAFVQQYSEANLSLTIVRDVPIMEEHLTSDFVVRSYLLEDDGPQYRASFTVFVDSGLKEVKLADSRNLLSLSNIFDTTVDIVKKDCPILKDFTFQYTKIRCPAYQSEIDLHNIMALVVLRSYLTRYKRLPTSLIYDASLIRFLHNNLVNLRKVANLEYRLEYDTTLEDPMSELPFQKSVPCNGSCPYCGKRFKSYKLALIHVQTARDHGGQASSMASSKYDQSTQLYKP